MKQVVKLPVAVYKMAHGRKLSFSAAVMVVSSLVTVCSGSAIPMWEFLSRGEKVSVLVAASCR